MMKKPHILLTNDDGIFSNGLKCLWEALKEEALLYIAAPSKEQSGTGAGITYDRPIKAEAINFYPNTPAYGIDGKPADCVRLALNGLIDKKIDLIISGINHGSNAGRNVLYSGTIGAIIEGTMLGIPGIALSYQAQEIQNFFHIKPYVLKIFHFLNQHPLPVGTILNINFPHLPIKKIKGCRMARQGLRYWTGKVKKTKKEAKGDMLFHFDWKEKTYEEHYESDIALLEQGYITAVPLFLGELTDQKHFSGEKERFNRHFFPLETIF